MEDVMIIKETKKNKIVKKFNEKYIIPYEINNSSIKKIPPKKIKKYLKNYKLYLENEKELYNTLINLIKNYILNKQWKNIDKSYQNDIIKVLYLFNYRSIIILYEIYWNYINKKVSKYVISLKLSSNKIYKDLNYSKFLNYIDKMNDSLLNLKKILLNNLYNIYKPNIIGKNYGIIYDKENYNLIPLIDDNILFTGNHKEIQEKGLFYDKFIVESSKDNFKGLVESTFFTEFKENDYYDKNSKLFIGASYDLNNHIESVLGIISTNSKSEKKQKKITYKIVNYTIKIFQNCIPIELVKNLLNKKDYLKRINLNEKDKTSLKNYIIKEFNFYMRESTKNILLTKKSNDKKLIILKSKIYYNISFFIMRIVQINIYHIDLKNQILNEIEKLNLNI